MSINTTQNYSPNFDQKKRKIKQIRFIIFHYTGMKNEKDAIKRLTDSKSKVSSHYFIKNNGSIITLVPELYVSWHAGISSWKNYKSINKYSIGIEISNPGHGNKYKKFSKKQIRSILKLSKFLIKKYKIKDKFILGHSDIAPFRKKDPGERFPWRYLSKNRVGLWHGLNEKKLFKIREIKVDKNDENKFLKNLYKIGYFRLLPKDIHKNKKLLTKAFQRRFRQELINGIIDKECLLISKNLTKS
ncbi:N-acetylmuramoyl-L-alanine amidase [Candidatus Pelagibacter sp.]|uniref:N-acetylmuramoyl-L-alanine amidase n=1 Tax=Candidatus Pelagibacter sp. TaxID=2024849 RepID=UPI003F835B60